MTKLFSTLFAVFVIACGNTPQTGFPGDNESPGGNASTLIPNTTIVESTGGASGIVETTGGTSSTTGGSSAVIPNATGGNSTASATTKATGGASSTSGSSSVANATGGKTAVSTSSSSAGGAMTTGGSKSTGGASSKATGGTPGTGGSKSTGGSANSTGGNTATGGATSTTIVCAPQSYITATAVYSSMPGLGVCYEITYKQPTSVQIGCFDAGTINEVDVGKGTCPRENYKLSCTAPSSAIVNYESSYVQVIYNTQYTASYNCSTCTANGTGWTCTQ